MTNRGGPTLLARQFYGFDGGGRKRKKCKKLLPANSSQIHWFDSLTFFGIVNARFVPEMRFEVTAAGADHPAAANERRDA